MIQIWSAASALKTWQVKTIRPVGWSDEEGEGMGVCAESGKAVGIGVEKLKSGDAIGSTGAGDENEEGVNACSVANKSGVGVAADGKRHPVINRMRMTVQTNFVLFITRLD